MHSSRRRPDPGLPAQQLELVHAEVNRQRSDAWQRHHAIHQRAGIILGATGLSVGFIASRVPPMIRVDGVLDLAQLISWTGIAAVVAGLIGLGGSVLALLCLAPTSGKEVDARRFRDIALGADMYSAEYRLVEDKIEALEGDATVLRGRFRILNWSMWLLMASWAVAVFQLLTTKGV